MRMARYPTEEKGRVSGAHLHLKGHAPKRVAVNRAVFDKAKKGAVFTLPLRIFYKSML